MGELRQELIACLRQAHNKRVPRDKGANRRELSDHLGRLLHLNTETIAHIWTIRVKLPFPSGGKREVKVGVRFLFAENQQGISICAFDIACV